MGFMIKFATDLRKISDVKISVYSAFFSQFNKQQTLK